MCEDSETPRSAPFESTEPARQPTSLTPRSALRVYAPEPGAGLVGELRLNPPEQLRPEESLALVRAAARLRAFAAMLEAVGTEGVRSAFAADPESAVAPGGGPARFGGDVPRALAVSEVAAAQGVSESAAARTVTFAESLAGPMRLVRDLLGSGKLSEQHARVIVEQSAGLDANESEEFARMAIARLQTRTGRCRTAQELRPVLVRLREKAHPETVTKRRRRAARDRGIWFRPEADGMCTLSAYLPAEVGVGLYAGLDTAARSHRAAFPDDPRSLAQLRIDTFAYRMLTGAPLPEAVLADFDPCLPHESRSAAERSASSGAGGGAVSGVASGTAGGAASGAPTAAVPDCAATQGLAEAGLQAKIVVLIPAATLLGASGEPATLDGYGPLDPVLARQLAAKVPSWERLVTDLDGVPMMLGRSSYRPSAALRRFVEWRDATCVFPGCTSSAARAELDHTVEWFAGGGTDAGNLAALCTKHHALKSLGHWTMEQTKEPARASGLVAGMLASVLAERDGADARDDTVRIAEGTGFITWTSPMGRTYTTAPAEYDHGPEDSLLADALALPKDPMEGALGADAPPPGEPPEPSDVPEWHAAREWSGAPESYAAPEWHAAPGWHEAPKPHDDERAPSGMAWLAEPPAPPEWLAAAWERDASLLDAHMAATWDPFEDPPAF